MRRLKIALAMVALYALWWFSAWLGAQQQQCEAAGGKLVQAMFLEVACLQPVK